MNLTVPLRFASPITSILFALGAMLLPAAPAAEPLSLRVMTFNVEYGGTVVDFEKVIQAIQAAEPDIVALEEPAGNTREIAWRLGWPHFNLRTDVISRFRIIDPPGGDGRYVFVEVQPGRVVALANVHLPSDPYGPYLVRDHAPLADVLALEHGLRLPALMPFIGAVRPLASAGIPVFVLGDFNSPSHLDWTPAAVGLRPYINYPVPWPVSVAMIEAGFSDAFRQVHPDPIAVPGLTWWAPRPSTEDVYTDNDPHDRIDHLYVAGPARAVSAEVIGEAGHPDVARSVTPWPSDHRAVVATFDVTPAQAPTMIGTDNQRAVVAGDAVRVFYWRDVPEDGEIVLAAPGMDAPPLRRAALCECSPFSGSVALDTADLAPGDYELRMHAAGGAVLSRQPLRVRAGGVVPRVTVDKSVYAPGESIRVRWEDGPGNRWDWIAIHAGVAARPVRHEQRLWRYVGSDIAGEYVVTAHLQDEGRWPLAPGHYTLFFLAHDTDVPLASTTFEVRAPGQAMP